jgi:peptide/nickel transport system permease protein
MLTLRTSATKLVRLIIVVIAVTFFSFSLIKLVPGDPVNYIIPFGSPELKAQLRSDLHLEDPFFSQYWHWLSNFFTGDMGRYYGTSFEGGQSVSDQVWNALPFSLVLMLYAQVLALVIAIPLGVISAYRAGSKLDGTANAVAFGFLALPSYVLAFFLAIWVAVKWGVLPVSAAGEDISPVTDFRYMILPTISLAVAQIAVYMRLLRSDMIATLREDFITTAQAKGIKNRRILFRHALRPSSLTLLTVAGLNVGALIGGAVVVETIFKLPGMGYALFQSIGAKQYVAMQSYIAVIAIVYVAINFSVDILYSILDPRIRHARAAA